MRVLNHGKEELDIELSDAVYRICGGFGSGTNSSVFLAEEIYKIVEEYPMPMEERNRYADFLSDIPVLSGAKIISDLRNPDFPYTTNLADIDEEEKKRVRETVCAEWERANPGYPISFYDEKGNLLCSADCRTRVLALSDSCLEIHMGGTIVRFDGEQQKKRFVAAASSMRWLCPEERKASAEEFDEYVRKLKAEYKTLARKTRPRILFADDKGKKLYSVR